MLWQPSNNKSSHAVVTVSLLIRATNIEVLSPFFSLRHFGHFFAETNWTLKRHLFHSSMETRRNSIHLSISYIVTELT